MREHALHQDRCIGHVVGAEKVRERVVWHHHAEKVVRAGVHHRLVAQRHKATFARGRQCDAVDLVARVRSRAEVFAAALHPAYRPREFARGEGNQHVLRRLHALLSEAAPHVTGDDADALRRHAKRDGHQHLQHVGRLRARPDCELPRDRIGHHLQAARLDRRGDIALRDEFFLHRDEVAALEGFLGIAFGDSHRQHEIAAELWLHQRGFGLERRDRVGHCWQLLVIDFDQLDRVERLRQRFSDYHG